MKKISAEKMSEQFKKEEQERLNKEKEERRKKFRGVKTVNFFDYHLEFIDKLIGSGIRKNRSDAVRYIIDEAIPVIIKKHKKLRELISDNTVENALEILEEYGYVVKYPPNSKPRKKLPLGNIYHPKVVIKSLELKQIISK